MYTSLEYKIWTTLMIFMKKTFILGRKKLVTNGLTDIPSDESPHFHTEMQGCI